jgi:glycosyltransferase involved in cell wall biosynthesis
VICIAPPDETSAGFAERHVVGYLPWRLDLNGTSPMREFRSALALFRMLARLRPALVLTFTIKPNIYAGIACRMLGIPYANTIAGLGMLVGSQSLLARLVGRLYRISNAGARRIFVQNPDDLTAMRRIGLLGDAVVTEVPGSGVDTDRFPALPPPPLPLLFLMMARLQSEKGVEEFVEAARLLHRNRPSARFVVLGSARFANRSAIPDAVVEAWRAEGIVEFPGHVDDVRSWLAKAHVLVLPSHGGEGMPRSLLEAASSARPAIASDVPGCRQAVVEGETGFLHGPRDPRALAGAMERFARLAPEQAVAMGRAARRLAEARFSERVVVARYLEIAAEVAPQSAAGIG